MKIITFIERLRRFFSNPKCIFCLGMAVTLLATTLEVVRGRNTNYFCYQDATRMFWEGISPYSQEFPQVHGQFFLYLPAFCVLFAPVFYLPWWLGPYVWNVGNFCLFTLSIWTLPDRFAPYRAKMYLFLLSLLLQSIFCYQYNTVVCYIFLFAFTLLERGKPFWAVLLIMISATTKIYGGAELVLLFCYPRVWRNLGYALLCGAGLMLLPAVNPAFGSIGTIYQEMMDIVNTHHSTVDYVGLLFARGLKPFLLPNYRAVQLGVLAILGILFFWRYERWKDFRFRVQALAIVMGYIILFSDSPETHTYVISMAGYAMAFWIQEKRTWLDWTLFWLLVVNFCILPTDVLCPTWLHNYVHQTFWLDVYTCFLCWLRIIWLAVGPGRRTPDVSSAKPTVLAIALLLLPLCANAQQMPASQTFTVKGVRFTMKYVEGGTFTMGALPKDASADNDEVRHRVKLRGYYMGETEVTQELWEAVMGKNRSKQKGADMPVEYVTYDMCMEFISKLNAMTGRKFRLPTEAEWEYAARGGRKSRGYLYSGSDDIDEVAHTLHRADDYRHKPVGQLKPNELGLYDMSGNVWELCEDWYRKTPTGRPSSNFRVIRGGGYDSVPRNCRSTNRFMYDQRRRRMAIGFRLAL